MAYKRRANSIIKINVNGVELEWVDNIKGATFTNFEHHFQSGMGEGPRVEHLNFKKITMVLW